MGIKWTEQMIREEAAKYKTSSEFKKGRGAASEYARTKFPGLLKELFPVDARAAAGVKRRKWTKELCHAEALLYNTRSSFSDKSNRAYQYALTHRILDEVCSHMVCGFTIRSERNRKWTETAIREIAATCKTRSEFFCGYTGAARAAKKFGIYEEICTGFEKLREVWTKELVQKRASRFDRLSDFYKTDPRAYEAMLRLGLGNEIGACMRRRDPSDRDTVYLWEAVGESYNGKKVYKIGITSERVGESRIKEVACRAGMRYRIIVKRWLGKWNVPEVEKQLLTYGENPKLDIPDGQTEFRALTDEEVRVITRLVESHTIL